MRVSMCVQGPKPTTKTQTKLQTRTKKAVEYGNKELITIGLVFTLHGGRAL